MLSLVVYLKGISTGEFSEVLAALQRKNAPRLRRSRRLFQERPDGLYVLVTVIASIRRMIVD